METDATRLQALVDQHPFWYHRIELPHGVVTPGWAPLEAQRYGVPERLDGLRVLDVGAWDGYWTFEALRRGAREVVAIDDFSDYLGMLPDAARSEWATFDLCREALGHTDAACSRRQLSVYDATPELLGRFDVVFCFGTLYHLRHPLLALDRLAALCDGDMYVESAILDDFSPYRGGMGQGYAGGQMVMEFYPGTEYGSNASNWWVPTLQCLAHMITSAGFPNVKAWKLENPPRSLAWCRGFARASRKVAA